MTYRICNLTLILFFIKLIMIYVATVSLFSHYYLMLSIIYSDISFLIVLFVWNKLPEVMYQLLLCHYLKFILKGH